MIASKPPLPAEVTLKAECVRCVLTTQDRAEIDFDAAGLCNHCRSYDTQIARLPKTVELRDAEFRATISRIKDAGKGQAYDCIVGLSGGVDSSYLALTAKREGLRPLAVHLDNGWNSELAVRNIENIAKALNLDLHTYVIDWEEFRDLQLAYLRASVVDIEVLTDHAISVSLQKLALTNGIKFILSGNNVVTEGVLPYSWTYRKSDPVNIADINRKFGRTRITTFPLMDSRLRHSVERAGIETVMLLDLVPYNKADVKRVLANELGWVDYGGKHYESVFTRFYQTYILPQKFGIDKRKAHLSTLICSGQMTKAEALAELASPPDSPERIAADKQFVIKKLGLSEAEFDSIMRLPVRSHTEFEMEGDWFSRFPVARPLKPLWRVIRPAFYGAKK